MKNLDVRVRRELRDIALKNLERQVDDFSITPWVVIIPPWRWFGKRPFLGSIFSCLALFAALVLLNINKLTAIFLIKNLIVISSVWLGFYGIYYFKKVYIQIFYDIKKISLLNEDTLNRWYVNNICPVWGYINILPEEERNKYSFTQSWKDNKLILMQFIFWSIVNGTIAILGTQRFDFQLSPGWLMQTFVCFLWTYSFMWTSHYGHSAILFLMRLRSLPIRYYFFLPHFLTLKSVGGRFVKIGWVASIHFWLLLGGLHFWRVLEPHEGESVFLAAIIAGAVILILTFYIIYQIMTIVVTQFALSSSMLEYKRKRLVEFMHHLEEKSNNFLQAPNENAFNSVEALAKYRRIFRKLPVYSLTLGTSLSSFAQMILNLGLFYLYIQYSIGGWGHLQALLQPLWL